MAPTELDTEEENGEGAVPIVVVELPSGSEEPATPAAPAAPPAGVNTGSSSPGMRRSTGIPTSDGAPPARIASSAAAAQTSRSRSRSRSAHEAAVIQRPHSPHRSHPSATIRVVSSGRCCLLPLSEDPHRAGPIVVQRGPGEHRMPTRIGEGIRIRSPGASHSAAPVRNMDASPLAPSMLGAIVSGEVESLTTVETTAMPSTTVETTSMPSTFTPVADLPGAGLAVTDDDDESMFRMNGSYGEGHFGADFRDTEPRIGGRGPPALWWEVTAAEAASFPTSWHDFDSSVGPLQGLGAAMRDIMTRGTGRGDTQALHIGEEPCDVEDGWSHASRCITKLVRAGVTFYIGITEDPPRRWSEHIVAGLWNYMDVLVVAPTSRVTGELEKRLIRQFRRGLGCTNSGSGNERPSGGQPHYLYVLVGHSGLLRRSRGPVL